MNKVNNAAIDKGLMRPVRHNPLDWRIHNDHCRISGHRDCRRSGTIVNNKPAGNGVVNIQLCFTYADPYRLDLAVWIIKHICRIGARGTGISGAEVEL